MYPPRRPPRTHLLVDCRLTSGMSFSMSRTTFLKLVKDFPATYTLLLVHLIRHEQQPLSLAQLHNLPLVRGVERRAGGVTGVDHDERAHALTLGAGGVDGLLERLNVRPPVLVLLQVIWDGVLAP